MTAELIAELEALHVQVLDSAGRRICEHCRDLCHGDGYGCDNPADAIWPCETMKIVERYK